MMDADTASVAASAKALANGDISSEDFVRVCLCLTRTSGTAKIASQLLEKKLLVRSQFLAIVTGGKASCSSGGGRGGGEGGDGGGEDSNEANEGR